MAKYRVHLLARSISSVLETADEAYRWLDQYAKTGERYMLCALLPEGVVTPIDQDVWLPQGRRSEPAVRGRASA
jgi:hypothetical protein